MDIKMLFGVLFLLVLSEFNPIYADDMEQVSSVVLGKHDGRIRRCTSKKSHQSDPKSLLKSCKSCGKSFPFAEQVLGGDDVDPPFKYPWMVNLKYVSDNETFCSGSLISENFVLTAAHCLVKRGDRPTLFKKQKTKVRYVDAKDINVAFTTKTPHVRLGPGVMKVILHPGFSFSHMSHDIALLKLKRNITCNMYQNPICLPPADYVLPEGTWLQIAGWGATVVGGPISEELKQARVKNVNFKYCSAEDFPTHYKEHYYCLQNFAKQSIYSGDSGGPVFNKINLFKDGLAYVLGVASQETYFEGTEPFLFCSVPKHMKWITEVTGLSSHKKNEPKDQGQSKPLQDEDETKSFDDQDETKSFDDKDETKSFDGQDETKSFDDQDETKSFDGQDETKSFDGQDETKSFDEQDETKSFDDQDETKSFDYQDSGSFETNDWHWDYFP